LSIPDNYRGDDVHSALELLRAKLVRDSNFAPVALGPQDGIEHLLGKVSEAAERVTVEHAGMAEELLAVYEQLGIVFEVTRKLPAVQRESEVVDLFVDCLRRSFAKREVFIAQTVGRHGQDWLETAIHRAAKERRVLVDRPPDDLPRVAEVMVGPVFAGDSLVCAIVVTRGTGVEAFHTGDMLLLESLTMFCGDLIRNHRLVQELREVSIALVRSLVSAVDQKDTYTSGHSLRVGYFATLLGKAIGLSNAELQMLEWSALLHDIGKIGIRDDVLKKEGKLTVVEFNHIKEHPVRSHKVVQKVPQLAQALDGVLHHHEHFDGTGYPTGLAGLAIPLQARVIQIADVFDALTSDRSYRPAHDWPKALDVLKREAGKTVDPHLTEVFDRLIREALESDPDGWARMLERANE
jgi:hypothetical protein